jgi:DNA polymerase
LEDNFLYITLPSGRRLAYYQPIIQPHTLDYEDEHGNWKRITGVAVTYMGIDQYTKKWERISTHGGMLTENIVQAIARDILAHGLQVADQTGHDIVGHVHDEIITVSPDEFAQARLEHLTTCMTTKPAWASDMWLGASGYVSKRYKKD